MPVEIDARRTTPWTRLRRRVRDHAADARDHARSTSTGRSRTCAASARGVDRDVARPHRGRVPGARRGQGRDPAGRHGRATRPPSASTRARISAPSATREPLSRTTTPLAERDPRACASTASGAKYEHDLIGYTARLDTIQALVLLRKLPHLERLERCAAARRRATTASALAGVGDSRLPRVPTDSEPVWHLYVGPDGAARRLADQLRASGIGVGLHYPQPVASVAARTRASGIGRGSFPVAGGPGRRAGVAADVPRHHRGAARACRLGASEPSSMASEPANEAPYRLFARRRVRRGRPGPVVHESLRLPHRRRDADRAVRRGSAGASIGARTARSRATRSSATASRSATRCSSGTG